MKKFMAVLVTALAFLCDNEILTLFIIAIAAAVVAVIILAAWAKTEKKSLPGVYMANWRKKK